MPNENTHAATIDQNTIAIGFGMRFFSIMVLICKFCGRVGSSVPSSLGCNPVEQQYPPGAIKE
jgi:hypothetical protein